MSERICEVEGCTNLGQSRGPGRPRQPQCSRHARERWPAYADGHRAANRVTNRRRRADGRLAASYASQLLRGVRVLHYRSHHDGMRYLLGGTPNDGLTVSRLCEGTDCPHTYEGHSHGKPYTLCALPEHYVLESQAANNRRKAPR